MKKRMINNNRIINGLWIARNGAPLSNLELLCIHSFCANKHDFHLWIYDDIPNIPRDTIGGTVTVRDAAEILPKYYIFFYSRYLTGFANRWRWELMRQQGGWYVDMDMICLRPFDFSDDVVLQTVYPDKIGNGVLKLPSSHFLSNAMADACRHPNLDVPWDGAIRRRRKFWRRLFFWQNPHEKQAWGEAGGPEGLTLAVKYFDMMSFAKPPLALNPIGWDNSNPFVTDELHLAGALSPIMEKSYGIHFYNEFWRRKRWNKNGLFSRNSPFETLKRRYLPGYAES